jgi:hypothetical protein
MPTARLIVVNGSPGLGKSTLARLYVDDHPMALNLDIDRVRGQLGRWQDEPNQAGVLARELSMAMADIHLRAGHDVVIPQYIGQVGFLIRLEQLANEAAAQFHELVLMDGRENSVRRFLARAARTRDPAHQQARDMLDRAGGVPVLEQMYDRLREVLTVRPAARVIASADGQIQDSYQALVRHLDAGAAWRRCGLAR